MQARFAGSFCSLVLAWLCALGATSARHATVAPATARGAVGIVLREVAGAPQLASRVVLVAGGPRTASGHQSSHHAAPTPLPAQRRDFRMRAPRVPLSVQAAAHRRRSRWRAYDAAAPPLIGLFTPNAR